MRDARRHLGISLALIVVTTFSSTVVVGQGARGATGDWSAINSVPNGDKLLVKFKNGQSVEGKLASVSNDGGFAVCQRQIPGPKARRGPERPSRYKEIGDQ